MKSLHWTEEEIEDLVSNSNPFTILGVLIFSVIKDAITILLILFYNWIIAPFLWVILNVISWIIRSWRKKYNDASK